MTGITFFFRKFFWSGEVAIKSTEEEEEKFISKQVILYRGIIYLCCLHLSNRSCALITSKKIEMLFPTIDK